VDFHRRRALIPREVLVTAYVTAIAVCAAALVAGLYVSGYQLNAHGSPWLLAFFALIAILAEKKSIRLTQPSDDGASGVEVSVAFLPLLFVAVAFGPLAAAVVGALTMLGDFGAPYSRWVLWTANRCLISGVAGLAASYVLAFDASAATRILAATAIAAFVDLTLDVFLASLILIVRGSGSAKDIVRATAPVAVAAVPLYTAVVGLLAYAYVEVTTWSAVMFFVPAFAAQQLFVMYQDQSDALRRLGSANARLERANLSFATALVATLDARDQYTAGHSAAVAIYSRDIAARMGMTEEQQQLVHLCGLVHDIGKIGLPAGLLEKPGPLTLEERRQMETHSSIGERILRNVDDYSEIAVIVRHHHERVDGRGYPDGLHGEQIPILSRIIAVADAYNAMTSDRPYRFAMPSRVARLRLAQAVESQFDTGVVAAFEAVLAGSSEEYRSGTGPEFTFAAQEREAPGDVTRAA
jgi:putative nucleotidyltransferase with HDIG domain